MTFPPQVLALQNLLIGAAGLEDKSGLFVRLGTLRLCRERKIAVTLHVVATVQEEIGSCGAATATAHRSPHVGIAVDTIQATDHPGHDLPPT